MRVIGVMDVEGIHKALKANSMEALEPHIQRDH